MSVSLAKYNKDGNFFQTLSPKPNKNSKGEHILNSSAPATVFKSKRRGSLPSSFRDGRKYVDIVTGHRKNRWRKIMRNIPFLFSLEVEENRDVCKMLKNAVVAENSETWSLPSITVVVHGLNLPVSGMFSMSPNKILLVFDSEIGANSALDEQSKLWDIFEDIRLWSEGELFNDRLVWLECFGIHPKCWSLENIWKIGQKWGLVIHVDEDTGCIPSLTHARLLVRTKAQNRIDARIRILFEHGCCEVWLKECGSREVLDVCPRKVVMEVKDRDVVEDDFAGPYKAIEGEVEGFVGSSIQGDKPSMGDKDECNFNEVGPLTIVLATIPEYHTLVDSLNYDMIPLCEPWTDPLVYDIVNCTPHVETSWFDPVSAFENETLGKALKLQVYDDAFGPGLLNAYAQNQQCSNFLQMSVGKRPRGRPKKLSAPPNLDTMMVCPPPCNSLDEAYKTWDMGKMLGVSTNDEDAMISALRKLKRIATLEGNNL